MKIGTMLTTVKTTVVKGAKVTGLVLKQKSPEIALAGNIIFSAASVGLAIHATRKLEPIIEETHEMLDEVNLHVKPTRRDYAEVYIKQGGKIAKLYLPSAVCWAASTVCGVEGHRILKKRVASATALAVGTQQALDKYRGRVADLIGKEKEELLYSGSDTKKKKVVVEDIDENGEQVTYDDEGYIYAADETDPRVFHYNRDTAFSTWVQQPMYIRQTLERIQGTAQMMFDAHGYLMLKDVLDMLGMETTEESLVLGWLNDGKGNKVIDFGLAEGFYPLYDIDNNSVKKDIVLKFNCDWCITDPNRSPYKVFKAKI